MSDTTQTHHLKELLQPDILIELGARVSGPVDLLQLKDWLDRWRLSEDGHSKTDERTVERLIQFKAQTWEALSRLADQLESQGTCVTPSEVAILLIEYTVAEIASNETSSR